MSGIVLELQEEAIQKDVDIASLLRKALLVARKLKLKDFETWVSNELNGYSSPDDIPDYRKLRGEIKALNPLTGEWIHVGFNESTIEDFVTIRPIHDALPGLVNICDTSPSGEGMLALNADMNRILSGLLKFNTNYRLVINTSKFVHVVNRVQNIILDWAITLEESGVIGEGLQFTEKEKESALNAPIVYNYINTFYGEVNDTQIQQDTKDSIQEKTK